MLMKSSTQSLTEQLSTRFAERIRNRLMAPGARLPSVRQCAQQHGVSPSTVVAAYDQLLAQGLVEARKNRGFLSAKVAERWRQPTATLTRARAPTTWLWKVLPPTGARRTGLRRVPPAARAQGCRPSTPRR